ncbi:hypothetical protein ACJ73_06039 [Blastomyces percursus]|uniref:Uncharacterized protein n=1 Tax=Blastomyces percursus TaxID=1658174 RepID=A0A1J9R2A3_9EURO|nr:hypothetical protein ACJ73_06039 [Blastomyces percursus]
MTLTRRTNRNLPFPPSPGGQEEGCGKRESMNYVPFMNDRPARRGELGPPSDPDISMQESSFDEGLLSMSIEPVESNPGDIETDSDTDPNFGESPKFNRLSDEQIVNTALISLLNVLTFSVPGIQAHWSLQRKAFKFGEGDTKLYEARVDGHSLTRSRSPPRSLWR